jgi:predicted outer membrane repeat protein
MIVRILVLYFVAVLISITGIHAAEMVAGNPLALQNALTIAQSNNQDDVIRLAAGTYLLNSRLRYRPMDNKTLTIEGTGVDETVIDGNRLNQIGEFDTTLLLNDDAAAITIKGLTLRNGNAMDSGGALIIKTDSASISVEETSFVGNVARGQSGGGLYATSTNGNIRIDKSIFEFNAQPIIGGGAHLETVNGDVSIADSWFLDNLCTVSGGGLFASSSKGNVTVVNTIAMGNGAGAGAGLYAVTPVGVSSFINNTIAANGANSKGGGLLVALNEDASAASLYNNIVWGNSAGGSGADILIENDGNANQRGSAIDLFNNNYDALDVSKSDRLSSGDNIFDNPQLTMGWTLSATSPCIDAGRNDAPLLPSQDYKGVSRIADGNFDGQSVVDIGADEVNYQWPLPSGANTFSYLPTVEPELDPLPSQSKPLAVGDVEHRQLSLQVRLLPYTEPVDIYLALWFIPLDAKQVYLVTEGDNIQPWSQEGLVPWKTESTGSVDSALFGNISLAAFPPGVYRLAIMVAPAGRTDEFHLWLTQFVLE